MAKAKVFYEVVCAKHGTEGMKADNRHRTVKVSPPATRSAALHSGCPYCNKEKPNGS